MRILAWVALAAVISPLAAVAPAGAARVTVVVTLADPMLALDRAERPAAIAGAHRSVLDDLGGPAPRTVRSLTTANVLIADVTPPQTRRLAADPRVAAVAVNAPVPAVADPATEPAADPATTLPPLPVPPGACTGTEEAPQLEPEALQTLRARSDDPGAPTAASLGYDGAGVTVGIISTDLDPRAPDFIRPDGSSAVIDYQSYVAGGTDQSGEGEEAFGDVSSVVAQGAVTYDLADYVDPDAVVLPDGHCWIRVVGVAPAADVVATNSYDANTLTTAGTVMAIDHAVAAGVDILSESFDDKVIPDISARRAIAAANDAAIDAGVTVVASTGDVGANGTIGNPATDPRVIAVGATVNGRVAAQVGGYGLTRFGTGAWRNGTTSLISSAGITQSGSTLDVVAPGDSGWAACSADPRFGGCTAVGDLERPSDLVNFSGTSQSAPLVAGVAALVVQAYRDGHGGADPTPAQVRQVLTGTADDLGLPADQQGAGQVDAYAAVLAARSLPAPGLTAPLTGAPAATPPAPTLVTDGGPFTLTGTGTHELRTTVTNPGAAAVTVSPEITEDRIDPALTTTHPVSFPVGGPLFTDGLGAVPTMSATVPITVQDGLPWFRLRMNAVPAGPVAFVKVAVFTPGGTLAGFGSSGAGMQLFLPRPEAGVWTVVVQSVPGLSFTGDLIVDRATRTTVATAPEVVVPPGGQASVTLAVPALGSPGDAAATLRFGDALTVPVIRRQPVDLGSGSAELTGTLGPVNGLRAPFQSDTWEFDVPEGRRSLSAGLQVDEVAIEGTAVLVDPTGVARSVISGSGRSGADLTQTVADPRPGRWRYTVVFWAVDYTTTSPGAPFTVNLALDAVRPAAVGLPTGAALPANTSVPVRLTVTNPGPSAMTLQLDARTAATAWMELPDAADSGTAVLPWQGAALPVYQIPAFSSSLTVSAAATTPTVVGVTSPTGDTDVVGSPGTDSTVTVTGELTPGPWAAGLAVPGAVGSASSPAGTADLRAVVETLAYDVGVTDLAGTPFVTSSGFSPDAAAVVADPGETVTIDALLPVTAASGTQVEGLLALVTAPATASGNQGLDVGQTSGDVVARFPYSYMVADAPVPDPTSAPTPGPAPTSQVVGPTAESTGSATPTSAGDVPTTSGPTGSTSVSTTAAPIRKADGSLAYTGADPRSPGLWGLALLAVGAVFVVVARRRRPGRGH